MKVLKPGAVIRDRLRASGQTVETVRYVIRRERLLDLIAGRRRIVRETAEILTQIFPGSTPQEWLTLQDNYDNGRSVIAAPAPSTRSKSNTKRDDAAPRNEALALVQQGLTSEQAGAKIGVKKMTVAGWRSAHTKGLYDDTNDE